MSSLDVGALLAYIAQQDGRTIGLIDVYAWTEQAYLGDWTKQSAFDAVIDFYQQDPQPCWTGTDEPRPFLPADVNAYMERTAA
jgi:hypothetical protein